MVSRCMWSVAGCRLLLSVVYCRLCVFVLRAASMSVCRMHVCRMHACLSVCLSVACLSLVCMHACRHFCLSHVCSSVACCLSLSVCRMHACLSVACCGEAGSVWHAVQVGQASRGMEPDYQPRSYWQQGHHGGVRPREHPLPLPPPAPRVRARRRHPARRRPRVRVAHTLAVCRCPAALRLWASGRSCASGPSVLCAASCATR